MKEVMWSVEVEWMLILVRKFRFEKLRNLRKARPLPLSSGDDDAQERGKNDRIPRGRSIGGRSGWRRSEGRRDG